MSQCLLIYSQSLKWVLHNQSTYIHPLIHVYINVIINIQDSNISIYVLTIMSIGTGWQINLRGDIWMQKQRDLLHDFFIYVVLKF